MSLHLVVSRENYLTMSGLLPAIDGDYSIKCRFRIKEDPAGTADGFYFLGLSCDGAYTNGDIFQITTSLNLRWTCYTDGFGNEVTGATTLTIDQDYDLCIVRAGRDVSVYIGGVLEDVCSDFAGHPNTDRGETTHFYLGEYVGGGAYHSSMDFQGMVVAETAWGAPQRSRMSVTAVPADRTAIYGIWPMLPGTGMRTKDFSGNGHDWTENGTWSDGDGQPFKLQHVGNTVAHVEVTTVVANEGELQQTLTAPSLTGESTLDIEGTATPTLATVTLSGESTLDIEGSSSTTVGLSSLTGVGELAIEGSLTSTIPGVTLTGESIIGSIEGELEQTVGCILTAESTLDIEGELAVTLEVPTLSASDFAGALVYVADWDVTFPRILAGSEIQLTLTGDGGIDVPIARIDLQFLRDAYP